MKIAIIENEQNQIEGTFDWLNYKYFGKSIQFDYFKTSQDFVKLGNAILEYKFILVDIHLTQESELDGFGLIKKILEISRDTEEKLIVLTGFHKVEERFRENGLPNLPIVIKPTNFEVMLKLFAEKGLTPNVKG